jgi:hypothetical protein
MLPTTTPGPAIADDLPCAECGWTRERQDSVCYQSHIKLFYRMSDRGAWSLGPKYMLNISSEHIPGQQLDTMWGSLTMVKKDKSHSKEQSICPSSDISTYLACKVSTATRYTLPPYSQTAMTFLTGR